MKEIVDIEISTIPETGVIEMVIECADSSQVFSLSPHQLIGLLDELNACLTERIGKCLS